MKHERNLFMEYFFFSLYAVYLLYAIANQCSVNILQLSLDSLPWLQHWFSGNFLLVKMENLWLALPFAFQTDIIFIHILILILLHYLRQIGIVNNLCSWNFKKDSQFLVLYVFKLIKNIVIFCALWIFRLRYLSTINYLI